MPVEDPQRLDAAVEDVPATLLLDVLLRVAGQGGDHLHPLRGQERGRVLLAGLEQDGQVAAVDDGAAEAARALHQRAKAGVQLRGAAGEIEGREGRVALEEGQDPLCGALVHHLGAAAVPALTRHSSQLKYQA